MLFPYTYISSLGRNTAFIGIFERIEIFEKAIIETAFCEDFIFRKREIGSSV